MISLILEFICYESEIIEQYSKQNGNTVQRCGLCLQVTPIFGCFSRWSYRQEWPGSMEVKKIHPRKGETLESALLRLNIIARTDGCLSVKENHQYYYQMQQQLFCTERKWVDFVASDGYALFVERVLLVYDFWSRNLQTLQFLLQCNF